MSLNFSDLAKRLFRRFTRKAAPARGANRFHPMLERCEDRTVPTSVVSIAVVAHAVEGGTWGEVWITRTDTTDYAEGTISLNGTAGYGVDYLEYENFEFRFEPTADLFVLYVNAFEDAVPESPETVVIGLTAGYGCTIGGLGYDTVNISDAPLLPEVSVEKIADATEGMTSGAGNGLFRFTRTGDTSGSLTVAFEVNGYAIAPDDYDALPTYLTFSPNQSTIDIPVVPVDDGLEESTEDVGVVLTSSDDYLLGMSYFASVSITDAPAPHPTVTLYALDDAVEGEADGLFRLVRTGYTSQPLVVNLAVGGTAVPGDDYMNLAPTAYFGPGESSINISVYPVPDQLTESPETVSLAIQASSAYAVGVANAADVKIFDVAPPPAQIGSGTGLFARYYNTKDLYDLKTTRIDEQIKFFDWQTGGPTGTNVGADNFSVQWVGKVQAQFTGAHMWSSPRKVDSV